MDMNSYLTLIGAILTAVAVWYARRGAVAAEEAVRVARIPLEREEKEKTLSSLERAILRAALDALKGVIYYHRHFEGKGPHVVFWTFPQRAEVFGHELPAHEPIPDPSASVERLIALNYLEEASPNHYSIGLTSRSNILASCEFDRIRITAIGRQVAASIEESAPIEFLAKENLREFKDRYPLVSP